jgi:opacity protein-like surface antigen
MKKIVLTFAVLLGFGLMHINAQDLSIGIKASANMSNFFLSDMKNAESTMKIGASLGGFFNVPFNNAFSLQPELIFHYKSSEMKQERQKTDYEYWGMEIPIYFMGKLNLGNGRGYAGIGPYVGLGFDAKYKNGDIDLYKKNKITDNSIMNRWDFGAGVILGYEFNNGFLINAGYQIGITDLLDANKKNATMRNQTVNLGIGYKF